MDATAVATMPKRAALNLPTLIHHVWALSPLILVHVGALAIFLTGGALWEWLLMPLFVYLRGLVTTIGYHRYFSHRSFKTSRVTQFLLGFFSSANLQQGPLWWAAYHRHHHRHSDDPGDVHSPYHGGFWWAYCGWLFVPLAPQWRDVSDLRRYPELVWLERFWQLPGFFLAGLSLWAGGWSFLCVCFCLSAVANFHLTFVVNTYGHLLGSRRYNTGDESRNSLFLAFISLGDGWHNNHHHYPHAAQAGFFWWEIDASFRVIRLMEMMGLVWDVRRVPAHKLEPSSTSQPQDSEDDRALASRTP
ncbi:MAG: acyl-CoA desaturase [Gemmataceae bacterium]|nr:acyl-CoA desaturase [Gemmataceae bacterium]